MPLRAADVLRRTPTRTYAAPHGSDLADAAAGFQDNYGHHHPGFMHGAANAITSKSPQVSVIETVVDLESAREKRQKA
jgi:2-succinyl-5-enolpyruvyl-6-hydroxy-3-cyclohexene-1-carboxylate synthase